MELYFSSLMLCILWKHKHIQGGGGKKSKRERERENTVVMGTMEKVTLPSKRALCINRLLPWQHAWMATYIVNTCLLKVSTAGMMPLEDSKYPTRTSIPPAQQGKQGQCTPHIKAMRGGWNLMLLQHIDVAYLIHVSTTPQIPHSSVSSNESTILLKLGQHKIS